MSKLSRQIRNLVFVLVVVLLSFACTIELLQIQIVDGEYYKDQTANTYTANQTVQAARGQIFTKDGKVVNTNRLVYKIIVQKAFFKSGTENDVIAKTLKILQNNDQKWIDTLPVSKTAPYKFTGDDDEIDTLRSKAGAWSLCNSGKLHECTVRKIRDFRFLRTGNAKVHCRCTL